MAKKRMGYEAEIYYGTAGSTAGTLLSLSRDMSHTCEFDEADVSDRGSIINDYDAAGISIQLEFELNNNDGNAAIATFRTAGRTGGAIALRTKDKDSGVGWDGDFVISLNESQPLRDAQRIGVTARPTQKEGRTVAWN